MFFKKQRFKIQDGYLPYYHFDRFFKSKNINSIQSRYRSLKYITFQEKSFLISNLVFLYCLPEKKTIFILKRCNTHKSAIAKATLTPEVSYLCFSVKANKNNTIPSQRGAKCCSWCGKIHGPCLENWFSWNKL